MTWVIIAIIVVFCALLLLAYYKGKKDERQKSLIQTVEDLIATKKKQEAREFEHDKRVRDITAGPVDASDAERMLQKWPDEGGPTT